MTMRRRVIGRLLTLVLVAGTSLASALSVYTNDSRQIFAGETHEWLRAVGKLQVPGQRYREGRKSHYVEDCSATLVARPGRDDADTLITAWHCLEWYGDLSRPIMFSVTAVSGKPVLREVYKLQDGGGMHADWAILRLRVAIPKDQVAALYIHPQSANPERQVVMAGFSKDAGLGSGGNALTYDPGCAITEQNAVIVNTNCTAFKGASGGAVVQVSDDGEPQVCGVISQGNGEGRSTFVPVSIFRSALGFHLQ
jgi:Trypsin-like peptidase domain